ncbi:MAG: 16S rRNA (guanine(966)-N(2))-methyltransferase RsmD [Ignavibacteria bacterium]|nr:16S rRNA (guanine(966)-N(2))-methyltransferase RsmD [Ignavibacteria bacterium]
MRIIAGLYRGRTLSSTRDRSVRPTTDRAKQTIFDILSHRLDFNGIEVLDLFAGSGSLGLEALSRGAAHATFVDKARPSLRVLERNIAALGCQSQCTVYLADVFWFLKNTKRSVDLIFVDPPYKLVNIGMLSTALYESAAVKDGTSVILEHSKESDLEFSESQYDIIRKPFGQTMVVVLKARVKR